jgi:hypothetical protein
MKIYSFEQMGDHQVHQTPFMKIHLESDRCPNLSNLVLTTQWIETEEDCRRVLQHLGQEAGMGHLTGIELVMLLGRVEECATQIAMKLRTQNGNFVPSSYLSSIFNEFAQSEIKWRTHKGEPECPLHLDVWAQFPNLKSAIVASALESMETGRGFFA